MGWKNTLRANRARRFRAFPAPASGLVRFQHLRAPFPRPARLPGQHHMPAGGPERQVEPDEQEQHSALLPLWDAPG